MQLAGEVEAGDAIADSDLERVPSPFAVGRDEVQVIAADLDPLCVVGEPEADQRPLELAQLEHVLVADDLGERPVRRQLARDRARADDLELPVDADRAAGVGVRRDRVELGWNFLEYALAEEDIVLGWLIPGIMFELMAVPALLLFFGSAWLREFVTESPKSGSIRWKLVYVAVVAVGAWLGMLSFNAWT